MGSYFSQGICFDDVARLYGEAVAQEWYEACGGAGPYIPGYTARPSMEDDDGSTCYGGPSLAWCEEPNGGAKQFWAFDKFIKAHRVIPQTGDLAAGIKAAREGV